MLKKLHDLFDHLVWADRRILEALRPPAESHPDGESHAGVEWHADGEGYEDVIREFAHVIGAEEVWLSRLEGRPARAAVWPDLSFSELERLMAATHDGFRAYLAGSSEGDIETSVSYTNSSGSRFSNGIGDILLHIAMHGQYHRGKVNLLLRRAGRPPVPADYIAYVRGAPAATTG